MVRKSEIYKEGGAGIRFTKLIEKETDKIDYKSLNLTWNETDVQVDVKNKEGQVIGFVKLDYYIITEDKRL